MVTTPLRVNWPMRWKNFARKSRHINQVRTLKMKEDNGNQDVGATAFDYPNSQHPGYTNPIYHTSMRVPSPTNSAAKIVNPSKIMRQVLEGK